MPLFRRLDSQSEVATTPGDLLLKLHDTCPVSLFSSLVLGQYLCPALDALPPDQRANLMTILQEAERATVDVSSHFRRLDLSGEGSDDDDDDLVDPSIAAHIQLTERKRRIEALIAANTTENGSSSELDEEVLSWLPILWHLGVEVATYTGEVLAALRLCDAIRYAILIGRGRLLGPHGFTPSQRCSSSLNCSIRNIKKSIVYSNSGSLSEHIGWIRRELLLKKSSSGEISRVLPVLSELYGDDLRRIAKWLPESTVVGGEPNSGSRSPNAC